MPLKGFPEQFRELWNRHDLGIVALYREDAVLRDSGQIPRDLHGRRDIEAFYADQWRGAPKSHMIFHRTAIDGHIIFVEWQWWPLGKAHDFSARGMSRWTLSDGQILRDVTYFDPTEARRTDLPWNGFTSDSSLSQASSNDAIQQSIDSPPGEGVSETRNAFVKRFFELWNAHTVEGMAPLYAENAVMVDSGLFNGQLNGRVAIADYYEDQWSNSPDATIKSVCDAKNGDDILVEWAWQPRGDSSDFTARGISVWTVRDGKIVNDLTYWDPTALRQSDAPWKALSGQ